jgi:hypothetical protein
MTVSTLSVVQFNKLALKPRTALLTNRNLQAFPQANSRMELSTRSYVGCSGSSARTFAAAGKDHKLQSSTLIMLLGPMSVPSAKCLD